MPCRAALPPPGSRCLRAAPLLLNGAVAVAYEEVRLYPKLPSASRYMPLPMPSPSCAFVWSGSGLGVRRLGLGSEGWG